VPTVILPLALMTIIVNIMPKTPVSPKSTKPHNNVVAVLAYDGVNTFELGMAVEVFGMSAMGRRIQ
jgi:AraC family transcriptional regulator, transcriptional activator FtrA